MATVQEILNTKLSRPTFAFRPGQNKPLPDEIDFTRSGAAWTLDANRDIVKKSDGISRIYGPDQPLRIEPQRTQLMQNPTDLTQWGTLGGANVNSDAGSAKGQQYDELLEDSTDQRHGKVQAMNSSQTDQTVAISSIVKPFGRENLICRARASNNNYVNFNLSTLTVEDTTMSGTVVEANVFDVGGGWRQTVFVVDPASGEAIDRIALLLANGNDVSDREYQGDGSSGILHLVTQTEFGRFPTTPILDGGATRNADDVSIQLDPNDEEFTILTELEIKAHNADNKFYRLIQNEESKDHIESSQQSLPSNLGYIDKDGPAEIIEHVDVLKPYTRHRIALSITQDEVRLAIDGTAKATSHQSDWLGEPTLELLPLNRALIDYYTLSSSPEALSTTDLETLTSTP